MIAWINISGNIGQLARKKDINMYHYAIYNYDPNGLEYTYDLWVWDAFVVDDDHNVVARYRHPDYGTVLEWANKKIDELNAGYNVIAQG